MIVIRKEKKMLKFGMFIILTFLFSLNCLSQDTTKKEKVLFIQYNHLKPGEVKPKTKIFHIGKHVKIKLYNEKILYGRIDSIGDSSIIIDVKINFTKRDDYYMNDILTIKRNVILIKDIQNIKFCRGKAVPIICATSDLISLGGIIEEAPQISKNLKNDQSGGLYSIFVGCLGFGEIVLAATTIISFLPGKNYHLGKDFKLTIKTAIKK